MLPPSSVHDVTTQKNSTWNVTAMKASKLVLHVFLVAIPKPRIWLSCLYNLHDATTLPVHKVLVAARSRRTFCSAFGWFVLNNALPRTDRLTDCSILFPYNNRRDDLLALVLISAEESQRRDCARVGLGSDPTPVSVSRCDTWTSR